MRARISALCTFNGWENKRSILKRLMTNTLREVNLGTEKADSYLIASDPAVSPPEYCGGSSLRHARYPAICYNFT